MELLQHVDLRVNFEHRRDESSRAGYLMLAMGEADFVAVAVVFLFLAAKAGSLEFAAFKAAGADLGPSARWLVFLLTFFGFGVKAGLVPVNTWLRARTRRRRGTSLPCFPGSSSTSGYTASCA